MADLNFPPGSLTRRVMVRRWDGLRCVAGCAKAQARERMGEERERQLALKGHTRPAHPRRVAPDNTNATTH